MEKLNCHYDWNNPPEYLIEWAKTVGFKQCDRIARQKKIRNVILVAVGLILLLVLAFSGCRKEAFADEIDDIIPCIVKTESGGNPNAVSPCGAVGLMQITPIVLKEYINWMVEIYASNPADFSNNWDTYKIHRWKQELNLFNPITNLEIGEWYLRRLKNYYLRDNYTINRLLCAWNGGITRLRQVNYDINRMPKETRVFVRRVLKCYREAK
jgi:hypothetical protein